MKKTMKRRQFHLAADDEQILKEIASREYLMLFPGFPAPPQDK
jgi:hypothetical protein